VFTVVWKWFQHAAEEKKKHEGESKH